MFRAFPFRCPETGTPFRGTARTRRLLLCTAVLATLLGNAAAARAQTSQNVYATAKSPAGPTHVSGFAKDAATGTLSVLPGSPYDERLDGAAMVVDVLGRFLFIANPTNNDISMFQIDSSTGALTGVQRCCMDRGGNGIPPFPSRSVRRCVRTQAVRARSLGSGLFDRVGPP